MSTPIIALTTDFGCCSPYVAQMKAVILSALPAARILDVTHTIRRQSVRHAETVLRATAFAMPLGTVHVVVVDPGVGTERRGIAVQARGTTFVGPDNGVLSIALAQPGAVAVTLDRPHLFRAPVSATFHGRDIFAPVAAELAAGLPLADVGSPLTDPVGSSLPAPRIAADRVDGETLATDDFGNLTTNIPASALPGSWDIRVAGRPTRRVRTYGESSGGELLSLVGSDGYLEIAIREGSAAIELGAGEGSPVECVLR